MDIETAAEIDEIDQAILQLTEGDFQSKWDSAKHFLKQFSQSSDRVVPLLIHHLQNSSEPENQWFLVRMLGQFDHPDGIAAIAQTLLSADDDDVRLQATQALTMLDASAIKTLSELLNAPHQPLDNRLLAARALARIRRSATLEPLLSITADPAAPLRAIAIEAVGSFHDPRVTPVLIAALEDHSDIACDAIRALGRRQDLLATLDLIGPLQKCLHAPDESVAKESAIALGRLGVDSAAITLGQRLMQAAPTTVKIAIVRALGWMENAIALDYLIKAFNGSVPVVMPAVKREIACALGQSRSAEGKKKAAQPLLRWLQIANAQTTNAQTADETANESSADPSVDPSAEPSNSNAAPKTFAIKQAVISALAMLGRTDALDSLVPALSDPDPRIRMHALSALKQIDPRAAQVKVQSYLDNPHIPVPLRQQAADSLSAW
ncbi:MAG: HEAT repeat domain-containing protein [Phormidesmis sp.]